MEETKWLKPSDSVSRYTVTAREALHIFRTADDPRHLDSSPRAPQPYAADLRTHIPAAKAVRGPLPIRINFITDHRNARSRLPRRTSLFVALRVGSPRRRNMSGVGVVSRRRESVVLCER
jgi:hypothetical protein